MERNDTTSPIAIVKDGQVVGTFAMHDMGAFDSALRNVFFEILRDHPWLVFRSFIYDKPRAELDIIVNTSGLYHVRSFLLCIFLATAAGILAATTSTALHPMRATGKKLLPLLIFAPLSLSTAFIFPSSDVPDGIAVFLLVFLMIPASVSLFVIAKIKTEPPSVRVRDA